MPALAAAISRRRRAIANGYRAAGATTPEAAVTAEQVGVPAGSLFRLQVRRGGLVEAGDDRYWLDTAAEERQTRHRRLFVLVLALMGVAAVVWLVSSQP